MKVQLLEIFRVVRKEGSRNDQRNILFYNLDAIISVGYRVNSKSATQFRKRATSTLREYIVKGFALNDELMKNGKPFGEEYIKKTDLFEQSSCDYLKEAEETKLFYKIIHYAVFGKTAAEIIYDRVDSEKPTLGLTTWNGTPEGKILKNGAKIAKNYLNEKEISHDLG